MSRYLYWQYQLYSRLTTCRAEELERNSRNQMKEEQERAFQVTLEINLFIFHLFTKVVEFS